MTSLADAVRARFDVASEIGDELIVRCPDPDHDDRNPSAAINVVKGLWTCYACGAGGDTATLLGGGVSLEPSTDDVVASLKREVAALDAKPQFLPERWLDQFTAFDWDGVHSYWVERGLTPDIIRGFELGYDHSFQPHPDEPPVEAVTIPLRAPSGGLLGSIHRRLDDAKPKYHYPRHADVSKCLFAYERVRGGARSVVLTEGAVDAMLLWQEGIPALAAYSDRLSEAQTALIRLLDPIHVTLAFDADTVGLRAVQRVLDGEWKRGRYTPPADFGPSMVWVASWPAHEAKDIGDLSPDRRREVINQADLHG